MAQAPVRLLVLIRSLDTGGAQRQLIALLARLERARFVVTVASMYDGGAMAGELAALPGVRCVCLERRGRADLIGFWLRLRRLVASVDPHLLYGYLGPARVATLLVGRRGRKVVWGMRASNMEFGRYGRTARLAAWLERRFAAWPDLVLANSAAGRDWLVALGCPGEKIRVIENGIDLARFHADPVGRATLRAAWRIAPEAKLVALVGRLDPMKGHPDFLAAAALVAARTPEARFVCIGEGPGAYREALAAQASRLGLDAVLAWLPEQPDMNAAYSACDLVVSASAYGEGFSNVVAEAMACGVPCVVTDVGDSARIVGEAGVVVPPRNPRALADGILAMLARSSRSDATRTRIREHFSVERMVERTQAALLELVHAPGAA
jgi:glycosyltransferase involved in cell wall biosynthesis